MNSIQAIQEQLGLATFFTRMALKDLTAEQWQITPQSLGTNINWQFGHILIGNYHFGVQLIVGDRSDLLDVDLYSKCYHRGTKPGEHWEIRPSKAGLLESARKLDAALTQILTDLTEADLNIPVSTFNPAVTTKHAALLFCGSHQMYHNGQLALLRKAFAPNSN